MARTNHKFPITGGKQRIRMEMYCKVLCACRTVTGSVQFLWNKQCTVFIVLYCVIVVSFIGHDFIHLQTTVTLD